MKSHFEVIEKTLRAAGAKDGAHAAARNTISDLNAAGYIIVSKGAIGAAQREAVAQYKEDNRCTIAVQ